ncbi:MAG: hypothetical protein JOZ07_14675 [Solirubrobacterales bacterium]|nr:hypothetical protein [Solirubrobacterales bacterium]
MTRRALAFAGACLVLLALAAPAAARGGWSAPFELAKPGYLDYVSPRLAFSPTGASVATFGIENVDQPGSAQAYLVRRAAGGGLSGPVAVPGVQRVLALAYPGRSAVLLAGMSPAGVDCCSGAQAITVGASGSLGTGRPVFGGLTGATQGQLLALSGGQMLAAVATERGVLVSQGSGGFGPARLISDRDQEPVAMSAAWLGGRSTIVAWTAGTGVIGTLSQRSIDYATGAGKLPPHGARVALTVANGHRIDELAVMRRGTGSTLVWVESWYDRTGAYHSQVRAADVATHPAVRTVSPANALASDLSVASDPPGDQGIAWQSCTADGACTAQLASRTAHGVFGGAATLGPADAAQAPTLAMGGRGQLAVVWVRGGHPVAVLGGAGSRPSGAAQLSATIYAAEPTVAFGRRGQALAAWTQGTLNPSVVAVARP